MRFLADEDFPNPLVIQIRHLGHSVKTIQQKNLRGSSDETVINIALKEKRIILTFDKDFLKQKNQKIQIIVFQFPKTSTQTIIPLIENLMLSLNKIKSSRVKVLKFSKDGLKKI